MNIQSKIINAKIKYCKSPRRRAELIKKYSNIIIGEKCEVYDAVSFGSEPYLIELGNHVRITKGVTFVTHDGGVWVLRNNGKAKNADIFGKIKIGNNVHIGINAIIMPGVSIGDNVVIGVGAVVTKDIPANSIAVGIPARKIKTLDDYYEKNKTRIVNTKKLSAKSKEEYLKANFL